MALGSALVWTGSQFPARSFPNGALGFGGFGIIMFGALKIIDLNKEKCECGLSEHHQTPYCRNCGRELAGDEYAE
jgi:hypothetical protein